MLGDEAQLYAAHADHLRRVVAMRVRNVTADVIEDACAEAWAQFLRVQPHRENPVGWLVVAAMRYAIRERNRPRPASLDAPLRHGVDEADATTLLQRLPERERESDLAISALQTLSQLPARQREILALHVGGYSYAEIAAQLNATIRTVERQMARARHTIRGWQGGEDHRHGA